MKKIIQTKNAPAPIGPYNQAVKVGNLLFISGQIALDPNTQELRMNSIEEESKLVMRNLKSILNEAEMDFSNVVKTTIYLSNMNHFEKVNEVYSSYFEKDYPARATVAVLELPKSVNVEIAMIASDG